MLPFYFLCYNPSSVTDDAEQQSETTGKSMSYIMYKNRKIATLEQVPATEYDLLLTPETKVMWRVEILSAQGCWFTLATKHFESETQAKAWAIKNRDTSREA